jgi:phage gpG-like protein
MAATCEAKFEFPDLIRRFDSSWDRIQRAIAATVQTQIGLRFDAEGAHNGHEKWAPLKLRQGQILSRTGALRKSIAPSGSGGKAGAGGFVRSSGIAREMTVEVGSSLAYASVQNSGAIIRPVKAKALRYYNPNTGKPIFSQKSVIPARNFTDLNAQDEDEISQTLANLIAEILEGR